MAKTKDSSKETKAFYVFAIVVAVVITVVVCAHAYAYGSQPDHEFIKSLL